MDKNQAEQLARRIRHEAPHLDIKVDIVDYVGSDVKPTVWAVYIDAPGLTEPQPIESPSEWEMQKSAFRLS